MSVIVDPESDRRAGVATRVLLLACLPAVAVGVLIRLWLLHTSLVPLNADEGVTGLQASEVLRGKFRLMVAGNDYGASTETYLIAPLLAFWGGVWPLRFVPAVLSVVAAYALFRLARPILGRVPAAALALVGWTTSGAVTILFLRPYMGYLTGFIALIVALALACHAMRTADRLARTAVCAGFAAGFALWSHPIFGTVALLALIAPTLYRRRALRAVVAAAGRRRGDRGEPVAAVRGAERLAGVRHARGGGDLRRAHASGSSPSCSRGPSGCTTSWVTTGSARTGWRSRSRPC